MTKETALGMIRAGKNGNEILAILDSLTAGFDYIESPMIEQTLGIPTSEPIDF